MGPHGAGAVGAVWAKHHKEFANFLFEYRPKKVLEIGGASGILATEYCSLDPISWTIIEPNPAPVEQCPAHFIKAFFDEKFDYDSEIDTVVHSHVWEHLYEPARFIEQLATMMQKGSRLIFSVPDLRTWLDKLYTNCLNFEHTVFLTEEYIEYLLAKNGFSVEKKVIFMDGHSIFYAARKSVRSEPSFSLVNLYERNKAAFLKYINTYETLIAYINKEIHSDARPVYIFGAHIFTQALFGFGLDSSRVQSVLDNDTNKQGKRLYGTALKVESPEILKCVRAPRVILRAGAYNQEIKDQIVNKINQTVEFLE
jgi:hypothetical protein